ncbi:MAG: hypothetical protein RR461_04035 [Angelakisella sp.]
MDDVFIEKLVSRKTGGKELGIKLGAVALVVVAAAVSFMIPFLQMVLPLVLLGVGWVGWKIWNRSSVEYEYSLSNGELTIDAIYGQQKRKTVISIGLRERLELMAPVSEEYGSELSRTATKILDVASAPNAMGRWFMNVKGESGLTRVFFEPDERMVTAMRRCAPSKVQGR